MDTATKLNPKYTFDRFVVGRGNRFAYAVSMAVAKNLGEVYNPLLIYGNPGLGKTHLLHAVGHFVNEMNPKLQILYMTCEQFINDCVLAVNQKRAGLFRKRFLNVDVLMIDNIELIAGRTATQQEFFNMFNELYDKDKQIIMTSSRPLYDLAGVDQLLCSRFDWGLTAEIRKPDNQTKTGILRQNAKERHLEIPDEALQMAAFMLDGDVRQLEGYLAKLETYINMEHQPVTTELCLRIAEEYP